MNILAALQFLEKVAPVFASKGLDALKIIDGLLKKADSLPAPFDKLNPIAKEAETVIELFIAFDEMVIPPPA